MSTILEAANTIKNFRGDNPRLFLFVSEKFDNDFVHDEEDVPDGFMRIMSKEGSKDIPFVSFPSEWTMAHIMHHVGMFSSVSQAKKNGWNKPIPDGMTLNMIVGKQRKNINIFN